MNEFDRFTKGAQDSAQRASEIIRHYGHNIIDIEHILLALIEEPSETIPQILKIISVSPRSLIEQLDNILRRIPKADISSTSTQIFITPRVQRIIDLANEEANHLNDKYISTEHIFLAVLTESNTPATRILESVGVTRDRVYSTILQLRNTQSESQLRNDKPRGAILIGYGSLPTQADADNAIKSGWLKNFNTVRMVSLPAGTEPSQELLFSAYMTQKREHDWDDPGELQAMKIAYSDGRVIHSVYPITNSISILSNKETPPHLEPSTNLKSTPSASTDQIIGKNSLPKTLSSQKSFDEIMDKALQESKPKNDGKSLSGGTSDSLTRRNITTQPTNSNKDAIEGILGLIIIAVGIYLIYSGLWVWLLIIFVGLIGLIALWRVITIDLVPIISASLVRNPNQKSSLKSLLVMVGASLTTAITIGFLGYSLSSLLAGLSNWLISFTQSGFFLIAAVMVLIAIGIAIPLFLGLSIEYLTSKFAVISEYDNLARARLTGYLSRAVGYGTFTLISVSYWGIPQLSSGVLEFDTAQLWLYAFVLFDAILFILVTPDAAREYFHKVNWYQLGIASTVAIILAVNFEAVPIRKLWARTCNNVPNTLSGVGTSQNPKAWFSGYGLKLPDELIANNISEFRYAVCVEERIEVVQTCYYNGGKERDRNQIYWDVTVHDVQTNLVVKKATYSGSLPRACDERVSSMSGSPIGSRPSNEEVTNWLTYLDLWNSP